MFDDLKEYLSSPPLLTWLKPRDKLQLYLAISNIAISVVLTSKEVRQQYPVYYVSKNMLGPETNYSHIEQLVLALVMASR